MRKKYTERIEDRDVSFYVQAKIYIRARGVWEWTTVSVGYDYISEAIDNMYKREKINDRIKYRIIRVERVCLETTEILDDDYLMAIM